MPQPRHFLSRLAVAAVVSLAAILIMPSAQTLAAQDAKPALEEPQYSGQFAEIGPDGKLVALEQQKVIFETKAHRGFISASVTSDKSVAGAKSPVRATPAAHFVVRLMPNMETMDPSTFLSLTPFVIKKDQRTIPTTTAKAGMFQAGHASSAPDSSIAVTFKKYGDNSLEIIPSQPLPAGEYVLAAANGMTNVYCFGVD